MVVDVNIQRHSNFGYHYVTGHGIDNNGDLFVYFDGAINTTVDIMIHYRLV